METQPTMAPLTGGSLQDRIRLAVEAEILSGERPPGSVIDDRQLAERFQASRTPVREALLVLAAQGLVHIAPRAGIYVRRASINELVASLEALTEVESIVAGMAARRASPAQCDALRSAQAEVSKRAEAGDLPGYDAANLVLHEAIYQAGGNPVLVETVRQLRRRLAAYRQRSTRHPGRLLASDAEHRRIVAAICAGDPATATLEMRQHINLGGEAMVQLVLAAQALGDGVGTPAEPPLSPGRR
jgi:DNA-binding GntR family transcriptional regulator